MAKITKRQEAVRCQAKNMKIYAPSTKERSEAEKKALIAYYDEETYVVDDKNVMKFHNNYMTGSDQQTHTLPSFMPDKDSIEHLTKGSVWKLTWKAEGFDAVCNENGKKVSCVRDEDGDFILVSACKQSLLAFCMLIDDGLPRCGPRGLFMSE